MISRRWVTVLVAGAMLSAGAAAARASNAAREIGAAGPARAAAPNLMVAAADPGNPMGSRGPNHMWGMGRGPGMREGWGMGARGGMGGWHGRLAQALNLTDDQKQRLADIRDRQMRRGIQARADLALERLDLRKLVRANPPSQSAIDAQIDRIARTRADLAKGRIAAMLEMRNVLTPAQRKLLRERIGRMAGRGMRPGPGGDRGEGGLGPGSGSE